MSKPTPFGLGASSSDGTVIYLPLESVSVDASIFDVSALIVLKQHYTNPPTNGQLSSARYIFPIPQNAAVCAFQMKASDGRVVSGVVKEKEEAKKEFDTAVGEGKWAGLAHEVTSDVFSISIGAIPPGVNVEINLTYSTVIPENESELMNQIRFALPTFIGERYGAQPTELSQPRSDDKKATFTFNALVKLTSKILDISSPSHGSDVAVQGIEQIQTGSAALFSTIVKLQEPVKLDKEFVLSIQAEKLGMPRCVAEVDAAKKTVALSLTLVPRFGAADVESQEYVFVVDRSGSMDMEHRIEYARDALKHLMKGLPSRGTSFNIVSFGSSFSSWRTESVPYDKKNVADAITHIDSMGADMGGTEIQKGLEWVFSHRMKKKPTAVFLLTDGEIWQPDAVISAVRNNVQSSGSDDFLRVFTIGIGNGASTALCEGVARVGNGVCYMTTRSEDVKDRCSKLLRAARALPYGSTTGLTVDWGYDAIEHTPKPPAQPKEKVPVNLFDETYNPLAKTDDIGPSFELPSHPNVLQAPSKVPNLYPGNRFLVSAILTDTTEIPKKIVLRGTLPGGDPVQLDVDVAYTVTDERRPPMLHTLAAKRYIRELEDGNLTSLGITGISKKEARLNTIAKAAIVQYGTRYSLASRYTSFVAVDNREKEVEKEVGKQEIAPDNDDVDDSDDDAWESLEPNQSYGAGEVSDEDVGPSLELLDAGLPPPLSQAYAMRPRGAMPAGVPLYPQATGALVLPTNSSFRMAQSRGGGGGDGGGSPECSSKRSAPSVGGKLRNFFGSPGSSAPPPPPPPAAAAPPIVVGTCHTISRRLSVAPPAPPPDMRRTSPPPSPPIPLSAHHTISQRRSAAATPPAPSPDRRRKASPKGNFGRLVGGGPPVSRSVAREAPSSLNDDPVTVIADLQSIDGSYELDASLLSLLQRHKASLTMEGLKAAIPQSVGANPNSDTIWATVLAAAYMLVALGDKKSLWDSLWDKAQEFVLEETKLPAHQFNILVQAASSLLK